jgi:GNAT superfamily N-acetyltransferase
MDTQDIARRVLRQRMGRYTDTGPVLGSLGSARFRIEPGHLRVAYATLAPGQAPAAVATVLRYAHWHQLEAQWTVVPGRPGEQELPQALLAAGFRPTEDLLLMGHRGPIPPGVANPVVAVTRIASYQQMWGYEYGSRQCFYEEPRPSDALVSQRATERWREQERGWCRYYAAAIGGQMVGGCYVSLYEDVPTIMGVYTLPEARRRGVARTLLERAIGETITPSNDLCCLFVERGNPAELLYSSLGFVPLFESITFAR